MTHRSWVYSRLRHASVVSVAPGGIYPAAHLQDVPSVKPFLMYRMLPDTPTLMGDDDYSAGNMAFWVFAHDNEGDYMQIDSVLEVVKARFHKVVDGTNGIIRCNWESTSDDLRDRDMGTITRFSRFRLIYKNQ